MPIPVPYPIPTPIPIHIPIPVRIPIPLIYARIYTHTVAHTHGVDLLPCDLNGLSDPFVKMYIQPDPKKETKKKTAVVKENLNPVFPNAVFSWLLPDIVVSQAVE